MEFRYRAIDERRSQSPPPPAASTAHASGSADSHRSDGPVERVGNSAAAAVDPDVLWRQAEKARIRERILREEADHWELELEVRKELREEMLRRSWPALGAVDPDDVLRRQAEKARIRERILREEAEHWELELEVRNELREEMLHRSWPAALERSARGSDTPPALLSTGTITAANSSLPEAHPKSNTLATTPTKRKSPDRATGALLVPSSKKQKGTLTCMVCCITANSEKAMQDHLNGKAHKRKVVALPGLPKLVPDTEQERGLEAGEEEAMAMEALGDYKPTKFMMVTTTGELNEVTQMDGYLLCELCNVRTADRVTMMCHLQGSKHISKSQKKRQPSSKPSSEADGTVSAVTSAIGSIDPKKLALEDFSVPLPHTVRHLEGFLLCELCDVKSPSMHGMRQHLSGKKHKNKANASSDASVHVSTGGKEAAKAQSIDTDTALISNRVANVEAPLEKSLQPKLVDDNELQETVAPPKEDVATADSAKAAGTEMMKSSANSAGAQLNNFSNNGLLTLEVDNVMHPLSRVDGFLVCLSCDAKAQSETIMRSHLAGKKHKRKMTPAARGNNDLSVLANGADSGSKSTKADVETRLVPLAVPQANTAAHEEEESAPLATPQTKNSVAMALASMVVDQPAEAHQLAICIVEPAEDCKTIEQAEGEHADAGSNGSATETQESVRTNSPTVRDKPIKIQVEGKVFTVTQHENGSLSCEVCGVHGCDKDSMIQHLYSSTHWGKASLAEKKEKGQACMTTVAMVDKDGEVGSLAS